MKSVLQWNSLAMSVKQVETGNNQDQYNMVNFYFSYLVNGLHLAVEILFFFQIIYHRGFNLSNVPQIIYMFNVLPRLLFRLHRLLNSFFSFKAFTRNLQQFPLTHIPPHKKEECAICKEDLHRGRQLPCSHVFHQYLINIFTNQVLPHPNDPKPDHALPHLQNHLPIRTKGPAAEEPEQ